MYRRATAAKAESDPLRAYSHSSSRSSMQWLRTTGTPKDHACDQPNRERLRLGHRVKLKRIVVDEVTGDQNVIDSDHVCTRGGDLHLGGTGHPILAGGS